MSLLLVAVGLLVVGGLVALAAHRSPRWASRLGAGSAVLGCALAIVPAAATALGSPASEFCMAWGMPGGDFHVMLDALSGFFLIPTLLVCALAAVYGSEYLLPFGKRRSLGFSWFCFNLLVASMALVLVARNAVLFLLAWEVMALASFFLVTFENDKAEVREAGWVYLVATHLGTALLLVMFVLMGREAHSYDFADFASVEYLPAFASLLFILALVGFGTKAGFLPLHVWLPEAHPAAPSHVSAVMSGVMIKTGIYGIVRMLIFLGPPPAWWGWTLVAIGATSGVLGVLFALAQHDIKRLLAYHSVENIGIIALGLGLGVVGMSLGAPALIVLGFGGGLLHVLNHALFKGLLFLGAGSVLHATGTRDMDHLGGLLKRMRWTGAAFLVGAAAISGLPTLNGFVSEFLIYLGAFQSVASPESPLGVAVLALLVIAALALIGGLAVACFTKAFGIVFLGEPRSEHATGAHEAGWAMRLPMIALAAACVLIGIFPASVLRGMEPALRVVTGMPGAMLAGPLAAAQSSLSLVTLGAGVFLVLVLSLIALRRRLLAGRAVEETVTWDCGYARPAARMQYTSSSFAQALTAFFGIFLRGRRRVKEPQGVFPAEASLATETPDAFREGFFHPVFARVESALSRLRVVQAGRIQIYVLYIVLTLLALLALLAWKTG